MNTTNLILSLILIALTVGNGIYTCKLGMIKQRVAIDSAYDEHRFDEPHYPAADWANGAPYRKEINNGMDFSKR